MKHSLILLLLTVLFTTGLFPVTFYANHEGITKNTASFTAQKKQKDKNIFLRSLTKKHGGISNKITTLVVDGSDTTPHKLRASTEIRKAIHNDIPIVISQPARGEIRAITGLEIDPCAAAVVIPRNGGQEFEINVIRQPHPKRRVHALSDSDSSDSDDSDDLDSQVHTIKTIIERKKIEKSIKKYSSDNGRNHRRWTVIDAEPFFWGDQGQFIHVGFQYDLYDVVNPVHRKYLTIQSVGTGVSAGTLAKDSSTHRGFFQTHVSVGVKDIKYKNWKKTPMILEKSAPESDNNSNTATVTTGVNFTTAATPGITFTGMPFITGQTGIGISYAAGRMCSFHDFTVNRDPIDPTSPSSREWTYWLSGASGSKIRKSHTEYDLLDYLGIKELPQLAKDSVLMPHMECVYYADGNETGRATITGTISQKLMDITHYVLFHRTNRLSMNMNHLSATIDFSQVDS